MKKKIAFILAVPKYTKSDEKMLETFVHPKINYDILYLTDNSDLSKVLIKDMTIDKDKLETDYDFIVPIGASPYQKLLKHSGGVTKYHGTYLEEPFRAVPLIDPAIIKVRPNDEEKIKEGFDKVWEYYKSDDIVKLTEVAVTESILVDSSKLFSDFITELNYDKNSIAYDLETTSLNPYAGTIIGASFSKQKNKAFFVPIDLLKKYKKQIKEILTTNLIVMHNAKFDKKWTKVHLDIEIPKFMCTMLAHYFFIDPTKGTRSLKLLAMKGSNLGDYSRKQDEYITKFCRKNKIKKSDFTYNLIPIDILVPYACSDADATLQIYNNLIVPAITTSSNEQVTCFNELILKGVDSLMEFELAGAPISEKIINKLDKDYLQELKDIKKELRTYKEVIAFEEDQEKEFLPSSYQQLGKLLFKYLKLPVQKKTATGAPSTDVETLDKLEELHPIVKLIKRLRTVNKMHGTYVVNIKEGIKITGRMHGTFNLDGTVSGRLSSSQEQAE